LFDAAIREPLADFFRRALARDPARRFDNVEDMRSEWRQTLRGGRSGAHSLRTRAGVDEGSEDRSHLGTVTLETSLAVSGLSTRAVNALERENALTIRDLSVCPCAVSRTCAAWPNKTRAKTDWRPSASSPRAFHATRSTPARQPHARAHRWWPDVFSVDLLFRAANPQAYAR